PIVTTLSRIASGSSAANQERTCAFAREPLRISAMTFVSRRNFTALSSVQTLSAARSPHHRRRPACPAARPSAFSAFALIPTPRGGSRDALPRQSGASVPPGSSARELLPRQHFAQ